MNLQSTLGLGLQIAQAAYAKVRQAPNKLTAAAVAGVTLFIAVGCGGGGGGGGSPITANDGVSVYASLWQQSDPQVVAKRVAAMQQAFALHDNAVTGLSKDSTSPEEVLINSASNFTKNAPAQPANGSYSDINNNYMLTEGMAAAQGGNGGTVTFPLAQYSAIFKQLDKLSASSNATDIAVAAANISTMLGKAKGVIAPSSSAAAEAVDLYNKLTGTSGVGGTTKLDDFWTAWKAFVASPSDTTAGTASTKAAALGVTIPSTYSSTGNLAAGQSALGVFQGRGEIIRESADGKTFEYDIIGQSGGDTTQVGRGGVDLIGGTQGSEAVNLLSVDPTQTNGWEAVSGAIKDTFTVKDGGNGTTSINPTDPAGAAAFSADTNNKNASGLASDLTKFGFPVQSNIVPFDPDPTVAGATKGFVEYGYAPGQGSAALNGFNSYGFINNAYPANSDYALVTQAGPNAFIASSGTFIAKVKVGSFSQTSQSTSSAAWDADWQAAGKAYGFVVDDTPPTPAEIKMINAMRARTAAASQSPGLQSLLNPVGAAKPAAQPRVSTGLRFGN